MNAGWLWDAAILTRFHLDPRARTPSTLLPRRQHPCPASHHVRRAGRRMDGRVDEAPQLQENTMRELAFGFFAVVVIAGIVYFAHPWH